MELYPRIGKNFDIKVFTNCRFGMMSWAVLAVTYCIKQVGIYGWNFEGKAKVLWKFSFRALLWSIWLERNLRSFEDKAKS